MKLGILALFIFLPAVGFASTDDIEFKAGASSIELSMPAGVSLAGYGGGKRRNFNIFKKPSRYATYFKASQGELDPLRAKVLILQKGKTRSILVGIDLVASSKQLVDEVAHRLSPYGVHRDEIWVSATHTHSGPGAFAKSSFWEIIAADKFNGLVFSHLASKVATAIEAALSKMAPAHIAIGQINIENATYNRRRSPDLDTQASVVRVDHTDGSPIAIVLNYPIHGTVLGTDNFLLSSDVMGATERFLEQKTKAVAIFLNGAEGDVSPSADNNISNPARKLDALGEKIATPAFNTWASLQPTAPRIFKSTRYSIGLPRAGLNGLACVDFLKSSGHFFVTLGRDLPREAPFFGLQIDEHVLVTFPGEPISALGSEIKGIGRFMGFKSVSVVSLTNEHLGYILTEKEYFRGGYEACGSPYGSKLGPRSIQAATYILQSLAWGAP